VLLLTVLLGISFLAPKTASAEDDVYAGYKPRVVPECLVYKTKTGKEVCGYATIEEVRALYAADAELHGARAKLLNLDLKIKVQAEQVADLRLAVSEFRSAIEVIDARSAKLTKDLLETDLKYQKERVKPRFGNALPWGVAGVASALLVGFVARSVVE